MYHFEPLKAYLDSEEALYGTPSLDMIIYKDGKEIFRHMAGHSDVEKTIPTSENDLYSIYSASKISTCVGTLRLIERGIIGLDDPVSKYLPNFKNLTVKQKDGTSVPAKNVMTIRNLMSMAGGLDYDMHRGSVDAVIQEKGDSVTTFDIVNAFADSPLEFEPGTHFLYSLCHDALGGVIEAATGKKFSEYLQEEIFTPLGMTDTTFHPTEEQMKRYSAQYRVDEKTGEMYYTGLVKKDGIPESYESGGGGLISSVNDYIKLAAALANKGTALNGYQLLKPETVELYSTDQMDDVMRKDSYRIFKQQKGYTYCLGVRKFIDDHGSTCPLGHFGWDGAAGFYVMIDTENNLAYVYAQHVTNHMVAFLTIHKQLRDLTYLCLNS